jgi:5-dehydro-2-deoxygluconokinase
VITEARPLDVVAIGRAAVDLYGEQVGGRLEDMTSFAKYLGGCPANICVGAARLGLRAAMITRVGDEHMGRFVREALAREGVDVRAVRTDPERLTALAVLGIRDRETFPLIFYRENCADMAITPDDMDPGLIGSAQALVVTGTHFSKPGPDAACRAAIAHARAADTRVVLDIDYRPVLWGLTGHGAGEARFVESARVSAHLQSIVAECDLVVGTEEEFQIAGGARDTIAAVRALRAASRATFVVKLGNRGCAVLEDAVPARIEDALVVPGFPVEVFNVLGAGDGFMAGLLRGWLRGADWRHAAIYANGCGALVVARHACAPAMPSWAELEAFLARARDLTCPRTDPALVEMHRVADRRDRRPELCALAFDHRRQFEDLAARHGRDGDAIASFKRLIAAGAERGFDGSGAAGAIIDDIYGREALQRWTGSGWWLARPVELPGATPLAYQDGPDPALTLRGWPGEHVAKCLVQYDPDGTADVREHQEARVALVHRAARGTGHEWLLEIVPPGGTAHDAGTLGRAMTRFYEAGIRPDWWKLPPSADPAYWTEAGDTLRRHDPYCRGLLVLGLDAGEGDLAATFAAAGAEPLVRGFAVGRRIFWPAAEAWFAGDLDDERACAEIAASYRRVVALWRGRRAR